MYNYDEYLKRLEDEHMKPAPECHCEWCGLELDDNYLCDNCDQEEE